MVTYYETPEESLLADLESIYLGFRGLQRQEETRTGRENLKAISERLEEAHGDLQSYMAYKEIKSMPGVDLKEQP